MRKADPVVISEIISCWNTGQKTGFPAKKQAFMQKDLEDSRAW
jgi:hypothetical protein